MVIEDEPLHAEASEVCQRLSITRRVHSLADALAMLSSREGWAGVVVEARLLGSSPQAALAELRKAAPSLPTVLLSDIAARPSTSPPVVQGVESVDLAWGRTRLESFARRALVLELVPDPSVAASVDRLSSERRLTAREVQLLAYALGREPRTLVLRRLGISINTLKTQVRGLLRKCGGRSLEDLAERVSFDARSWTGGEAYWASAARAQPQAS